MLLRRGWSQNGLSLFFLATIGLAGVAFISIYADDRMAALSMLFCFHFYRCEF